MYDSSQAHVPEIALLPTAHKVRSRTSMPVLFGLVFVTRAAYALLYVHVKGAQNLFESDILDYFSLATSLLHGSFLYNGVPNLGRTPGYPLLLAPAVWSGHVVLFGILENIALAVVTAWVLARIAEYLFPGTAAASWAVLLYCFEPISFHYSTLLLSETLFAALFLVFVWLIIRFLLEPSRTLALPALALSAATYTRPVTLYFIIWLVPFFLLFPRRLAVRQRLIKTAAFVAVFAISVTPWIVRNAAVADYHGFASVGEIGLYFYSAASIQAKLDGKSFAQELDDWGFRSDERYFQDHPEQKSWSQGKVYHYMRSEGLRIVAQYWPSYLAIHARGSAVFLFDTAATRILREVKLYPQEGGLLARVIDQGVFRGFLWLIREYPVTAMLFVLLAMQLLLYYLLAIVGLRAFPTVVTSFFVWTVAYFVLVCGGPIGHGRYRMPIMPLVCLSAGAALARRTLQSRNPDQVPAIGRQQVSGGR